MSPDPSVERQRELALEVAVLAAKPGEDPEKLVGDLIGLSEGNLLVAGLVLLAQAGSSLGSPSADKAE